MTTRPGYIKDSEGNWILIGPATPIGSTVYYQASEPSSPATGDIWIDSDYDVPSVDSSQFLRWRKTLSGGETSLSGNDDTGLSLSYTPGYEQVYLNGVLLVRSQDYTATDGTTITGLTSLSASDVIEVFSVLARIVGDVYTQSQSDNKYAIKNGSLNTNPVFSAYRSSNILFASGGLNPAPFDTKEYDSHGFYNTSTYRFTPNVPGYYQLTAKVMMSGASVTRAFCSLVKNSGEYFRGNDIVSSAGSEIGCIASGLIYLNGSTDYVTVNAYANNSGTMQGGQHLQNFTGFLVRGT